MDGYNTRGAFLMRDSGSPPKTPIAAEPELFLFAADTSFRFRYVSGASKRVCGFKPEELQGKPIDWLLHDPQCALISHREFSSMVHGNLDECCFETSCRHKNGSTLSVTVSAHI